ncbi:MAG: 50S ribosome-binding GTPase [Planctomycetales bacterium]|nr:50S ribosome-binding GTPase [Planctomycetales bacterium]
MSRFSEWLQGKLQPLTVEFDRDTAIATLPAPTLWLYGKTGSGKTSIIRYLTNATTAEIGNGFRPCTQTARRFSFPDTEMPLVNFLDTRGLGEANYDPTADLTEFADQGQLVIVTVRVTDHANDEILQPFEQIRRDRPERPVLLVLTCLHDAYPGLQHPAREALDVDREQLTSGLSNDLPSELRRSIAAQCRRWSHLVDDVVAVDLTTEEDGFDETDYGGQALKQAILRHLPAAYRQTLIELNRLGGELRTAHQRTASRVILTHSILAASAAAVPVPWVDIPAVLAIQSSLAHRLASLNRHDLDTQTIARVTAALGGRVALRMGLREVLKIVPWIGSAANAASCFALTYAAGRAWNWYFMEMSKGHVPDTSELRQVYRDQLKRAAELWHTTHDEPSESPDA